MPDVILYAATSTNAITMRTASASEPTCRPCCTCVIGSDVFGANDGTAHTGWTFRPAIRDTDAGDEPENSGGTFNFSAPAVELFDTGHPDGSGTQQHVKVRAQLEELVAGEGSAVDIFLGYNSDNDVVYVRVVKNPVPIPNAGTPTQDRFFGPRHDFGADPAGAINDFWTCPQGVFEIDGTAIASGHDGGVGQGGTPAGGYGGGGGAASEVAGVPVIPGVQYEITGFGIENQFGAAAVLFAEAGGRPTLGAGNERFGGRASEGVGDTKNSGGDGVTAGGGPAGAGSGGGGGANTAGNGANASGSTAGATQIAGGNGGAAGAPTGAVGANAASVDGSGGGGGGGSGTVTGGAGGLGGTGQVLIDYTPVDEPDCAHIEFRIRDSSGDYEIPDSNRIPIAFAAEDEWITIDVCLVKRPGPAPDYWFLRAKVLTGARSYPYAGEAALPAAFGPGDQVGIGVGFGGAAFDDFQFTYFREDLHLTCPNCNTDCLIGEDTFGTNLSQDSLNYLGCFWHVDSGTASISSGAMAITAGSTVRYLLPHPQNKTAKIVNVDLKWELDRVARVSLQTGYVILDETLNEMRLYNDGGGLLDTATGLSSADDAYHTVEISYDGIQFLQAKFLGQCVEANDFYDNDTTQVFVELAAVTNTVKFDNFVYKKHYHLGEPQDAGCETGPCTADPPPPPPPPPIDCPCCASAPPDDIIVDLGAGGWIPNPTFDEWPIIGGVSCPHATCIDCTCAGCVDISGEFLLSRVSECAWGDGEEIEICSMPSDCCSSELVSSPGEFLPAYVTIALYFGGIVGSCVWTVTITAEGRQWGSFGNAPCARTYARYESAVVADCNAFPVTLNKVEEIVIDTGTGQTMCIGALPATITLEI